MPFFRYDIWSPIRLLLPVSGVILTLPFVFDNELLNYYSFPVFGFFGSYFFFLNFPSIGELLHTKPIYVDDLVLSLDDSEDHTFKQIYSAVMNLILSILVAGFSEYIIIQGVRDKSIIEICGIIGGNLSLYMKTQNVIGKLLLNLCNKLKISEVRRRRMSSENPYL